MTLHFTRRAQHDLVRLRRFIAEKNPAAAERYSRQLAARINELLSQPRLGHGVEDFPGVRELVAGDYIVRYLLLDEELVILTIWHQREDR